MKTKTTLVIVLLFITQFAKAQWISNGPGSGAGYVNVINVNGTNIWAGCQPNFFSGGPGGVYLSTDNGNTWSPKNTGFTNNDVRAIVANGSTLYAALNNGGLWVSTNSGNSWAQVGGILATGYIGPLATIGNKIFAGITSGLYVSTNNGNTWTLVAGGLPASSVSSIAVSGTTMYVNANGGIYLSTDSGATWTTQSSSGNYFECMAIKGTSIVAGTSGSGVFLSTNNGVTWSAINGGTMANKSITSMAIDGNTIFVGVKSYGGCVFFSTNSGYSWQTLSNGFIDPTTTNVYALGISGTTIFAGENSGRVYKRSAAVAIGIEESSLSINISVFPNPFTSQTTINLNEEYKNVTIRIINALGAEVRNITFTGKQYILEREELNAGIYFIQILSESKIIGTNKILIN